MKNHTRDILKVIKPQIVWEGAGVRLNRVFGFSEAPHMDPFLLLDDFQSSNPDDYIKGFPWHPHRGIETVTYLLQGEIEHGDSLGNTGVIRSGDVQWMTAGSGIIHQEMPQITPDKVLYGFQLWVNLPSAHKMTPPKYRDMTSSQLPVKTHSNGTSVTLISGHFDGMDGPLDAVAAAPLLCDVSVLSNETFAFDIPSDFKVLCYVFKGSGQFDSDDGRRVDDRSLVVYSPGDRVCIQSGEDGVQFLLMAGKPLGDRVAWRGPIVMNTDDELDTAFREYREGTFIKYPI